MHTNATPHTEFRAKIYLHKAGQCVTEPIFDSPLSCLFYVSSLLSMLEFGFVFSVIVFVRYQQQFVYGYHEAYSKNGMATGKLQYAVGFKM